MLVKYGAGVGAGTRICGMRTGPFSPLFGIERLLKLTQAACVIFMYQRTIWRTAEGAAVTLERSYLGSSGQFGSLRPDAGVGGIGHYPDYSKGSGG